jgi:2',3'-cyclic-nucleotide 2'-phosphodiesterase/3'-nucleotidase
MIAHRRSPRFSSTLSILLGLRSVLVAGAFTVAAAVQGLASTESVTSERAVVTILATADLHGHVFPHDYFTQRPAAHGLAKVATLVRQIRRTAPEALLVDCGDTIQGSPLAYYHARHDNTPVDPMMLAMNALGYVSLTIGNHEFNYGLEVLHKARNEASFPWLSANTMRAGTSEPAFAPFVVREVDGVRVGILGITTPGIPGWENPDHIEGLEFADPVDSAARWVAHLREIEHADVVVAALHMGMEENLRTGRREASPTPRENAALEIARTVSGIDLVLMAHTHREVSALVVGDALLAQPGRWGDHLVRADLHLERPDAASRWRVIARSSRTIPVRADTTPDPEILALVQPYENATQAWLGRAIGTSAAELRATESRLRDTALLDLVQRVQLDAGAADVSMAASFNTSARIPAGDVTVRDIASLYVYDNTLVVVALTGAQLKEALEHSARYFRPFQPGLSAAELVDTSIPGYNFDVAEGVDYVIDLRRPPGDRIVDLRFDGEPLAADRVLRVATNNYRHNGGGGYTMYRDAPVLHKSSAEIRDLIIEWVDRNRIVPAEPTENWRIVTSDTE